MSESWSEIGRDDDEPGQTGSAWSTNGKGVAEGSESEEAGETAATAVAVSEPESAASVDVDEGSAAEAAPAVVAEAVPDEATPAQELDPSTSFLTQLARAMQATAGQERDRIVADTERRRQARVDEIRGRETAEAARMRELADEDQAAIDTWAATEIARITTEQQRRSEALRADLDTSLGQHRQLIAKEIERVETAVATHRTELDAFFDALERETDPVAIAQLATRRPEFPSIDTVPLTAEEPVSATAPPLVEETDARADDQVVGEVESVAEVDKTETSWLSDDADVAGEATPEPTVAEAAPAEAEAAEAEATDVEEPATVEETPVIATAEVSRPLVSVMDYSPDPFGDPWRDLPEKVTPEPDRPQAVAETESGAAPVASESEAQAPPEPAVASAPRGRSVLQAVPALRPMGSWLGRHANSDQPDIHS
jgi:hypothetical protein